MNETIAGCFELVERVEMRLADELAALSDAVEILNVSLRSIKRRYSISCSKQETL